MRYVCRDVTYIQLMSDLHCIILYIEVVFPKKPVTFEDQSIALNMFSNKNLKKKKKKSDSVNKSETLRLMSSIKYLLGAEACAWGVESGAVI